LIVVYEVSRLGVHAHSRILHGDPYTDFRVVDSLPDLDTRQPFSVHPFPSINRPPVPLFCSSVCNSFTSHLFPASCSCPCSSAHSSLFFLYFHNKTISTSTHPFPIPVRSLQDPTDRTEVRFIYANKTEEEILLREELLQLEKKSAGRVKIWYVPLFGCKGCAWFMVILNTCIELITSSSFFIPWKQLHS